MANDISDSTDTELNGYVLFLCVDTLSLMACVYSLRQLFMNYNELTHQEYVLAGKDYNH